MSEGWLIAHYVWTYGGDVLGILCILAAFRWGGHTERWVAGTFLAGSLLTFTVAYLRLEPVPNRHPFVMVIDMVVLAIFVTLSLRSRRPWTLVLAAFQFNDVLTYPAAWLSNMDTFTFLTALEFWSGWGLIPLLAWGTWEHARGARQA